MTFWRIDTPAQTMVLGSDGGTRADAFLVLVFLLVVIHTLRLASLGLGRVVEIQIEVVAGVGVVSRHSLALAGDLARPGNGGGRIVGLLVLQCDHLAVAFIAGGGILVQ